jgi:hypothetical protein
MPDPFSPRPDETPPQRCIVLGSCYEPEIDKEAAKAILSYLMAGGRMLAPLATGAGGAAKTEK